ncbi:UDP-N-acetylmuramoyl-L-alanyl-D-glutamate--2,6-diaminopimelate ligase [Candidatus Pelagibacter sp.]|nr:UDP-N-acetylmuramoyl-L-alanyl-D-glutamate--2,6-diaminopimelate ligase [Candidatus Pelagibacter sp.]
MRLGNFLKNLDKKYQNIFFSGITFDSSKVKKDNIFFAIKGNKFDGNNFTDEAIKKGAKVIISEKNIELKNINVIFLKDKNPRKLLAQISFKFLKKNIKKLIAVTGTNGKSSVADFYYQILNLNKKKVASIGTIGVQSKNKKEEIKNTTLNPIELSEIINNLTLKKINHIIMEASSHGLKQNRLDGLLFDIGIFTNLSQDHLDYHKNFKEYLNAKLYLFKYLIKKKGSLIVDPTIPQFNEIKKIAKSKNLRLLTIFENYSDLKLVSHKYKNEYQILKIKYQSQIFKVKLNLIGKIQVKNLFMAILASIKSNLSIKNIMDKISKLQPAEGRLEKIGILKNNSKVILDYAHTPDALKTVLINVKEQFPSSKISLVFGCGGDRDKDKRSKMGKIASKYADKIYLTDDNPRNENPQKIRNEIKKGIKNNYIQEISKRKKAIFQSINNLYSGDIVIIAGKGHEKTQNYKGKNFFLSDRNEILKSISIKNRSLFKDIRLNIIQEKTKTLPRNINFDKACINSKEIKKNDIFFAIKGKKNDGNKFLKEVEKKQSSIVIVNRINKNLPLSKQVKVKDTLKFLTNCASFYRNVIETNIISITGSCGKTTLKEMLGKVMQKITKTSFSPKSYNNKYGVPLSLFNTNQDDKFGVFEVGMDKKGEIDYLTKILRPDLGIITNISYAHSKNFKNIKGIAQAKSEMIDNIKSDGTLILNADDYFYKFHKKKAMKRNLNIISFGIKDKSSNTKLTKITKIKKKFKISFKLGNKAEFFYSNSNSKTYIQNLLASITVLNIFFDIKEIPKNIFLDFKLPEGRGDISKLRLKNKMINFVDESYNSNPLSLKTALTNYANINSKNRKKHVLLGDMLELGSHSLAQHRKIISVINKLNIDKVHVIGKDMKKTYVGVKINKKGLILNQISEINDLINKRLSNNDYLMIKGSNSTGLYKFSQILKRKKNVL